MRALERFLTVAALGAVLALPASADVRKDNIDVIIAFDRSLSMVDKVDAVKDWVNASIIEQLLIPGDNLVVVAFYGKADVIISQAVSTDSDKRAVKSVISKISGNGHFTDIGNALDVVKAEIAKREKDGRDKYVLLLTDGIQEAPHSSKYYSKDGTFNHEFLLNTKTIPEKGWKVMILGLGTGTAARDLATELKGTYAEVSAQATSATIAATAQTVFSTTTMTEPVSVAPVRKDGSSSLTLSLRTAGLPGDIKVTISDVSARYGAQDIPSILPAPVTFTLKGNAGTVTSFPVKFPPDLPQGSAWTTLSFSFASPSTFVPASTVVKVTVNGALQNNIVPLGAGALVLLALIAVVVVLVVRRGRGKPVHFAVLIDGEAVGDDSWTLPPGRELFLSEVSGAFSMGARKSPKAVARFAAEGGRLVMSVLRQDRFPKLKEIPADARGKSFTLRTENGRSLPMKVQSKERK